jgi:hypothetical protein
MHKFLKWSLVTLAALFVLGYFGFQYMKSQTKMASPEETVSFALGSGTVEVTYSRPSVRGRSIFGGLVPYGKVWRTGANEATTITFSQDVMFGDKSVLAGTYTLWSVPGPDTWQVMVNSKMYGWGVNFDGEAQRDPLADVAEVKVPVRHLTAPVEQFTIAVTNNPAELTLSWSDVQVGVPLYTR